MTYVSVQANKFSQVNFVQVHKIPSVFGQVYKAIQEFKVFKVVTQILILLPVKKL